MSLSSWLGEKKSHESTFKPPASHPSWSRIAKRRPQTGVGLGVTWLRTQLSPMIKNVTEAVGVTRGHVHVFFIPCGTEKLVRHEYNMRFMGHGSICQT